MKVMKKKIIYVLCILAVFLALLGLKKRNDTMYSSGVYHLNRSGIVESIDKNIIVVRLDKLNEQDEDFKNKRVVKFNEEKNNICLMHFRGAFGIIRTKKKK